MEATVFMTGNLVNYKTIMKNKEERKKIPTMIQRNELNYRSNPPKCTTHLLWKRRWRTLSKSPCRINFDEFISAIIAKTTQININFIHSSKQKVSFGLTKRHLWLMLCLLVTTIDNVQSFEMTTSTFQTKGNITSPHSHYSQLLSTSGQISIHDNLKNTTEDDIFRPFVPKDPEVISRNVFTPDGQFRVFEAVDTDLRVAVPMQRKSQYYDKNKISKTFNISLYPVLAKKVATNRKKFTENVSEHESTSHQSKLNYLSHMKQQPYEIKPQKKVIREDKHVLERNLNQEPKEKLHSKNVDVGDVKQNEINAKHDLVTDLKSLEDLLVDYVTNFFDKGHYEPLPGLLVELQNNQSQLVVNKTRTVRQTSATDAEIRIDLPRTLQTGRLLFLTGLKKVLWPVFMGLQVLKSLLIAMFIPALIGSFTKLLGKGITTGSAPLFIRPMEPPQELDFRDNTFSFEDDNKFLATDEGVKGPYAYNSPDVAQLQNEYAFDPASTNNQLSYIRLGMNERQHQLMQDSYMNALQSIGSASFKNSGSLSSGSSGLLAPMAKKPPPAANINTFQQFQNVPDSSLLLSNYDPFYSPLLSRLDSVFAQLKLNSDKETCREKLICLMYANPAKYAPYSNLVSAQLSRELNELRKPTSDNPDILRFFKYMRAAKDGQDGVDCEKTFDNCTEFKDFDNPAMVSTYHDINKLVQARKLTSN